ncbi:MAG: hypothetical protein HKO09_11920, partial [Croceitalea sp.]|nr:hypothetical protein [Croceitalea sp.]
MESYNAIIEKLNAYTKKHYQKLLVKGILLFLTLGFLFFLTITAIEYFLWLGSSGRLILLLFFVGIELYLLFKFILIPISFLFKVKRGLTNKEASTLIGRHFTSVGDKLINLLDLANNQDQTDLLVAAIDQRSAELKPIPFTDAVNMKEGLKPARYLVAPILIVLLILLTGNLNSFLGSYDRVVNYDVAYEPPAPFTFELLNTKLNVLEDETVVLSMTTLGSVRPEKVSIVINGRQLLMKEENGTFKHTLVPPLQTSSFYFLANDYNSRSYELIVGKVPTVSNFVMELRYPSYLNMRNETLKGSGNATVPEGTKINWRVEGINTTAMQFKDGDSIYAFEENDGAFEYGRNIYNGLSYNITTSNENVKDYESLGFQIQVIKDEYPSLRVTQVLDSINPNVSYYSGWASDDNMLKKIRLVYYPANQKQETKRLDLVQCSSNVEQFYYTFPSGIAVEEGKVYEMYFEAIDNDGLRNGKITKSQLFRSKIYDDKELKDKELNTQKSVLKQMDKSLIKMEEQRQELKQLNDQQKEGKPLSYTDKTQLKNFLSKQKQQEELMQKFSQQLKEGLKKSDQDNERNKLLQERMERLEKEAERNKKLMEELSEIADKIDKEDLKKKLEELGKKQGNGQRNLEQILELTKRYYVAEKAAQLASELEQLSKKQTDLSDTDKEEKKDSQLEQDK